MAILPPLACSIHWMASLRRSTSADADCQCVRSNIPVLFVVITREYRRRRPPVDETETDSIWSKANRRAGRGHVA